MPSMMRTARCVIRWARSDSVASFRGWRVASDRWLQTLQDGVTCIDVVLHGHLAGSIVVDGTRINNVMPGFAFLSDGDIASVLTFLGGLRMENRTSAERFKASEIAGARSAGPLSIAQVLAKRKDIFAKGLLQE